MTEEEEMLAELKAISSRSSSSRFDTFEKKIVKTVYTPNPDTSTTANKNENDLNESDGVNFLRGNPEDGAMNQYWYSQHTISAIASDIQRLIAKHHSEEKPYKVAFLSTPSLYFALSANFRKDCHVFDYDTKWSSDRGFVFYDYNSPLNIPEELLNTFSLIVIDPPFITTEVWEQYAITARTLLIDSMTSYNSKHGAIIGTTVQENKEMMESILQCKPQVFKPSIPNLVYQYFTYANFEDVQRLGEVNVEIGD